MPLYYFDFHEDRDVRVDDVGVEFENPEQACKEARQSLSDIASEEPFEGGERRSFLVLVRDDQNAPIYTANLNYTGLRLAK